eukprot:CAMPEP_0114427874 /NCGR_PEP_ID=MMETSP0103-20121206/8607_1 /TAXON_ID=37642 ORGANISM="Paraphysomonas imperforata, Strain PA2" /NCGR_SAMPLE_ID=MMETSP0103 /ASSEMBLY_ACC=CAM_ASM_000201 /LENGTH=783 /DNA_ID=CAMNT_0001597017 /DNA_START=280 /DNA_END=2631 /DNA_ORIENTATION=+
MFEKSAILSQLPASQRDEDDQPEGTVNPAVVCTILSLLSKDSVEKKFMFLYELHFDNKNDMEVNIKGMTDTLIKGMLAVFKISKIPSKDIQYASVFTSLRTIRNSQRLQNEVDEVENNNEDVLTMSDFFQLCQESHVVSKLLNAILHLCAKQQVVQATEQPTTQLESKLVSTEVGKTEKVRHPLWNFYIMDMFNESWLAATPQVANTRTVSSCIELFLYSGKQALPVYFDPNISVFGATDASVISFDKKKNIMRVNELKTSDTNQNESDGFLTDSYQFQGLIDEYTIMLWFAECCPANVTEKSKIERKSIVEIQGGKRRSSIALKSNSFSRRSSSSMSLGRSSLTFGVPQMGGRARRTSFNSAIGSQWRDMGVQFAATPISYVLKDFITNPNVKTGYKSTFECILVKEDKSLPPRVEDEEDFTDDNEDKKLRCEVGYTVHDIFQTDQFMYNVVEMIARGFRNVPLAASRLRPYTVSHTISSVDVAAFLRLYPKECLGRLATTNVLDSGLMRVPLVVSCDMNYGSAIQHLKQFKVDTAAIIDSEGRWVGRLDCKSAAFIWWRWKSLAKGVVGDQAELDMLRDRFSHENYDEFNVSSIKNFSAFSMMMNPLRECTAVGINIYDFEDQFKAPPPPKAAISEEDGSGTSTSDSESSSTSGFSDSESTSSSNSDSDDEDNDDVSKLSMSVVSNMTMKDQDAAKEAKLRKQMQFTEWLRTQGLLIETDTITSALEVMTLFKSTKAFVVNAFGEVIGVVSIRSIAVEILKYESVTQRENYHKALEEDKDD